MQHPDRKWWEALFKKVRASKFLTGNLDRAGKTWRASFDWLLKGDNALHVIEGQYDDREAKTGYRQLGRHKQ